MIERHAYKTVLKALERQAVVAIIGPRQVGKTTLAHEIANQKKSLYLDLETQTDRDKIINPQLFLSEYPNHLVILDEIHRVPEIFQELRGIIDERRRAGNRVGHFLILGSASIDLLKQSGETLAGRIEYIDLNPLNLLEVNGEKNVMNQLWVRGGFPDSFFASSEEDSRVFRNNFIKTYLERDIPQFGFRIASQTLERFWRMLAHHQGSTLNASKLGENLSVSAPTVSSYVDLLVDLLLVRRLMPYHKNTKKRLVKSPKIYIRDSGLLHTLLDIPDYNALSGHPVVGVSWEGFVIENILSNISERMNASFYRTTGGAEIDLLLEIPRLRETWAIEIKRSLSARPRRGFYNAIEDLKPDRAFVIHAGDDEYPITEHIVGIGLEKFLKLLISSSSLTEDKGKI